MEKPKTDRSRRTLQLVEQVVGALRKWRAQQAEMILSLGSEYQRHGFIFAVSNGSPTRFGLPVRREFTRILAKASLPRIRIYDLRHTAASLMMMDNPNPRFVADQLGHSNPQMTLNVYTHSYPSMQREAVEKLGRLFG